MSTDLLEPPATEVLDAAPKLSTVKVFNPIEAGIALMLEKHGAVLTTPPDVSTATALKATKANLTEMVKFRTSIEAARKAEKEESLNYGRLVDSEAKRITAIAAPIEKAYNDAIVAEEQRLEALRQAELEAERKRITGHMDRIQAIKDVRETANLCRTSDRLKQLIDGMPAHMEKPFEEFQDQALTAFNEVCTVLGQLHEAKVAQEVQAAELARQQAELDARRVEQERVDREAREKREREEADAKAKRDAEAADLQRRVDEMNARELELQRRERETQQQQQQALLAASTPAPVVSATTAATSTSDPVCCENATTSQVCDECAETSAAFQADMGVTAAQQEVEPELKIGVISKRLAPLSITSEGLSALGFEPAKVQGASKLYHEADFPAIVNAAIAHLGDVLEKHATA